MSELDKLRATLPLYADAKKAANLRVFFKNSQHNIFLGIGAAQVRSIAKDFSHVHLDNVLTLMKTNIHDERSIAHAILCRKFKKGNEEQKTEVFNFYIQNKEHLRDWDAVDDTAPHIAGPYLLNRNKDILYQLAHSERLWDRRIAIVTTLHFVRRDNFTDALQLAGILLHDKEDLMHKAVGWVLREVGKKDISILTKFIDSYHHIMPRTMLRYAIERFPTNERKKYLIKPKGKTP